MNDMELTEALKGLYTGEDNSSPERELDASARELDECEKYYMFAPKSELFGITEAIDILIEYKEKMIYVRNRKPNDRSIMCEQVSIPFDLMPRLIHFLGWLVDSRDVGKE